MKKDKKRTALVAGIVIVMMLGLSFASVPLYRMFCQKTGYGGATKRAEVSTGKVLKDHLVTIRFDHNIDANLPWKFYAETPEVTLPLGEVKEIHYVAENLSDHTTTGSATFNVTPDVAGSFFNKIQCFCFEEQTLKAGEKAIFTVQFFVDPDILKDKDAAQIKTITLSYTFFPKKQ